MARPAHKEIPYVDPVAAFQPFAADPVAVLLDSADEGGGRGRYAYIAADPVETIILGADELGRSDPFVKLRALLHVARLDTDPNLPPFQTGLCGLLGYELGGVIERLPSPRLGMDFPAVAVGFYDTVIAFDTFERKAWVVGADVAAGRPSALRRIEAMAGRMSRLAVLPAIDRAPVAEWHWEMDKAAYEVAVQKAIDYIYAGDIFQANITTRAIAELPEGLDPFMLYRRLRWISPAPFAAYLSCGGEHKLLCASPERFLRLDATGRISTRPIKGTRPRGDVPELDAAYAVELTESAKDRAENLMIVDLLRNDISRVALIGSVAVTALCELETFARVHHLVSEVIGKLRPGFDAVDLFRATFPGGSVTGAPKIRAMEIIHELEPSRRGGYCGSIFWAGLDGSMDSNIVIRSMMVSGRTIAAHAGGGIVADSDPLSEYEEMRTKAQPLLDSVAGVRRP
ncbi:MAG: anthranilate synthase component I family protein [Rhodospirillales bacterium]